MEALILAGGLGTRIRPLTYTRPKPLLPIVNRTMVERVLDALPKDVRTVVLPVNYLGDLIREHFEDHPDPRLVFVDEPEPLGTGGAIKNCAQHFTGPFFVINADIVSSLDLSALREFHERRKASATISLWPVDEPWHFGVVRTTKDGRIHEFVEKPPKGTQPSNLINAGNYLLEASVLDEIPPRKFVSLERDIFTPMAARGGPIYGLEFSGFWVDCGRPETYLEANRLVLQREGARRAIGAGVTGLTAANFEGFALGEDVKLGPGARVQRSVILRGATVGKGATVVDSVLGEGAEVEEGARLERCVVGDFAVVGAGAKIQDQRIGMRPEDG